MHLKLLLALLPDTAKDAAALLLTLLKTLLLQPLLLLLTLLKLLALKLLTQLRSNTSLDLAVCCKAICRLIKNRSSQDAAVFLRL